MFDSKMKWCRRTRGFAYKVFRGVVWAACSLAAVLLWQTVWRYDMWSPPLRNAGVDTCPACYGLDMCSSITSGHIDYYCPRFRKFAFLSLFGVKNVYFACSATYGDLVAKKLGHSRQLRRLDERACEALAQKGNCDLHALSDPSFRIQDKIHSAVEYKKDAEYDEYDEFGMILCPTTYNLRKLIDSFMLSENDTSLLNSIVLANIWTIVNINPEPLIMRYINNSTEGWPVPKYLGACGRTTFQTYEGEMLSNFMSASWIDRARLAVNLLKAADVFTFNHTEFRFYLTDISLENIVMSQTKMWHPVFVDLENVIVVDKNVDFEIQPERWYENHTSEAIDCSNCFVFSSEEICQHYLSDHNHYAICKFIEESILHSVPKRILQEYPDVLEILHQCIFPPSHADRFTLSNKLINELEIIINNF